MAAIAGIYCADGRPAELAELRRITGAAEDRGPDGVGFWNSGPVALAHLQFHTTPESLCERQPLVSPGGEACLVWNGRVDNREELLAELAAKKARPIDATDPGIVLAAYLLWGTECVQHIVGDFALAVWDSCQRRLWCARDYIGIRPFFYFWDGKTFLFGPEIRALTAHPAVSLRINEGVVGEYLEHASTARGETLYLDIQRLPSGSSLTIGADGRLKVEAWWRPNLSLLNYRSDEEYAEHFRRLFDESIRCQTRCNMGWGIKLSGGLDSSAIAVSARAVQESRRILTYSIACPGKAWDESDDIRAVAERADLTPKFASPLSVDLNFFAERAAHWRDFPGNPNGEPMTVPMYETAKQDGGRVLLSGFGGDEWLFGDPMGMIDLAVSSLSGPERGRALAELVDRAKADCGGRHWAIFLSRRLLKAAAPGWARQRRAKNLLAREGIMSDEFLRRTRLADRLASSPMLEGLRFSTRAQRNTFRGAMDGSETRLFEWNDREAGRAGMEIRFPFFDRRVAEFCLRLPEEQRQKGSDWKRLLRNAMRERFPERVRTKYKKAEFSELFQAVSRSPQADARLQNLAMIRHTDWFDRQRLERELAELTSPEHFGPWPLWMLLGMDLWFEQSQGRRGTA